MMYLRAAEHRRGRQSGRRSANGPRSVSQYGKLLFELIEKIPKIRIKIGWHELSVCGGGGEWCCEKGGRERRGKATGSRGRARVRRKSERERARAVVSRGGVAV